MHPPLQARSATGSCQADNQGPSRLEVADLSAAAASLRISDILVLLLLDRRVTRSSNDTFDGLLGLTGKNDARMMGRGSFTTKVQVWTWGCEE